jgi:ATP-dependent 26S proteasome regulatory subunit
MSTPTTLKSLEGLPPWARQFSEKYYSRTFSLFVLHGNVRDLVPVKRGAVIDFVPLPAFLEQSLFGQRDLVIHYDRGGGLRFATPEMQKDFRNALAGYDAFHGSDHALALPRNIDGVLTILDSYIRLRLADGKRIALVIDFAETIAPAADIAGMSSEDRNSLVILKRWSEEPSFLRSDLTICLIAEKQSELNQGLIQHSGVAAIQVPLPDENERLEFVRLQTSAAPLPAGSDVTPEILAKLTAGLKRVQLHSILSEAVHNSLALTGKLLRQRKKEFIEAEGGGLLDFVESRYDLTVVAGNDQAKRKLLDVAAAIRAGKTDALPMGFVICGPVGTGKTFLTTCFAGEVGIPAVMLKNFRSMWQGVTEGNLERVLHLLKAMSPIAVIVDEADAQLGTRSSSGDSGVSSRVFAQIAQFMGNTELRGKVIWFLLTCRPDLLPVDLKRQGRAEEHIALFYPETADERVALLRAMQKKTGTQLASDEVEKAFLENCPNISGADIEAILMRARMKSALENEATVDAQDMKAAIEDFVSPSYPDEIELQTLVAVMECTSRSLLPSKYRDMNRSEVIRRAEELKFATSNRTGS